MSRAHFLLITAMLAGCATTPQQCPLPKTVTVTVDRYITPDDALLQHQPIEQPQNNTCGEAVRVARVRRGAIEQCNSRLDALRQATTDATR